LDLIRSEIVRALADAGYPAVEVRTELAPAWSTDLISESGRRKLAGAGIVPPGPAAPGSRPGPVALGMPARPVDCPRCGSPDTERLSAFGSTACKALWRCRACLEPFEQVKPL
jgi:ring-1,2-phenylacetyl-CoA epoxidase subunit PaaD